MSIGINLLGVVFLCFIYMAIFRIKDWQPIYFSKSILSFLQCSNELL